MEKKVESINRKIEFVSSIIIIVVGIIGLVYGVISRNMVLFAESTCGVTAGMMCIDYLRIQKELEESKKLVEKQSEVIRRLLRKDEG